MVCAMFALVGVIIGAAVALFAEGRLKPCVRRTFSGVERAAEEECDAANGDKNFMQQWQNLLSYGVQSDTRAQ